jgi:phosphoserine phosphatase
MINQIKVVSLALDGVLYDGPRAVNPLTKTLGIEQEFLRVFKNPGGSALSLSDAIEEGARIWTGVPVDGTLDPLVESLPLMKGAEETVAALKDWGFQVGRVSSGVSQFFMKPFQKRLRLDFAYSKVLGETDGRHDGSIHYVMGGTSEGRGGPSIPQERGFYNTRSLERGRRRERHRPVQNLCPEYRVQPSK